MSGVSYPDHYPEDYPNHPTLKSIDFPDMKLVTTPMPPCRSVYDHQTFQRLAQTLRLDVVQIPRDQSDAMVSSGDDDNVVVAGNSDSPRCPVQILIEISDYA